MIAKHLLCVMLIVNILRLYSANVPNAVARPKYISQTHIYFFRVLQLPIREKRKKGSCMKVFRDMFAAVLIGIMGGLIVTTFSYYHKHKEGGVTQTLLAVLNSFNTVADAYSSVDGNS